MDIYLNYRHHQTQILHDKKQECSTYFNLLDIAWAITSANTVTLWHMQVGSAVCHNTWDVSFNYQEFSCQKLCCHLPSFYWCAYLLFKIKSVHSHYSSYCTYPWLQILLWLPFAMDVSIHGIGSLLGSLVGALLDVQAWVGGKPANLHCVFVRILFFVTPL